jgi:hypothetical protein
LSTTGANEKTTDPEFHERVDTSRMVEPTTSFYMDKVEMDLYRNLNPDIVPEEGLRSFRDLAAQNQSGGKLFKNWFVQAVVGEVIGAGIEGIGQLFDVSGTYNKVQGTETEWSNWVADLGISIQDWTRENYAIHQTDRAEKGLALFDSTWWASNGVSIASTFSLMIPSIGLVRGVAALGRLAKLPQLAGRAANLTNYTSAALLSRHMESTREASGVFNETLEKYQDPRIAGEAASQAYKEGYMWMLLDIGQFSAIMKPVKFTNRNVNKRLIALANKAPKNSALKKLADRAAKTGKVTKADVAEAGFSWGDFRKTMLSEGVEELGQELTQKRGIHYGDVLAGTAVNKSLADQIAETLTDPHAWDAFIMGGLGGGVFYGGGRLLNNALTSSQRAEKAKELGILAQRAENVMATMNTLANKALENDQDSYNLTKAHSIAEATLAAAHKGDVVLLKDMYEAVENMTDQELVENNLIDEATPENVNAIKDVAREVLQDIETIESKYNKYANEINDSKYSSIAVIDIVEAEFLAGKYEELYNRTEATISEKSNELLKEVHSKVNSYGIEINRRAIIAEAHREANNTLKQVLAALKKQEKKQPDNQTTKDQIKHVEAQMKFLEKSFKENLEKVNKNSELYKKFLEQAKKDETPLKEQQRLIKENKDESLIKEYSKSVLAKERAESYIKTVNKLKTPEGRKELYNSIEKAEKAREEFIEQLRKEREEAAKEQAAKDSQVVATEEEEEIEKAVEELINSIPEDATIDYIKDMIAEVRSDLEMGADLKKLVS